VFPAVLHVVVVAAMHIAGELATENTVCVPDPADDVLIAVPPHVVAASHWLVESPAEITQ
jgi:hypothetical protein